jgi:hypothetical protein
MSLLVLWLHLQPSSPAWDCMCAGGSPWKVPPTQALKFDMVLWTMGSGGSRTSLLDGLCTRPAKEEGPAPAPDHASALIADAWQRWPWPNWRHEPPLQSSTHRTAHDPLPAGALSTAAMRGCCEVPLPALPSALAPMWKSSISAVPAAWALDAPRSGHGAPDAREDRGGSPAAAADEALGLRCADPASAVRLQPDGHEPFRERGMGAFHHRALRRAELARAPGALPLVRAPPPWSSACSRRRADGASGICLFQEPPLAGFLVRIPPHEIRQRPCLRAFPHAPAACMPLRHGCPFRRSRIRS